MFKKPFIALNFGSLRSQEWNLLIVHYYNSKTEVILRGKKRIHNHSVRSNKDNETIHINILCQIFHLIFHNKSNTCYFHYVIVSFTYEGG